MVRKTVDKLQEEQLLILKIKFESLEAFDQDVLTENNIEAVLEKAIASLPEKCREIFVKSRIEGKKQKEIAVEMAISINTIETQMGIAYKKLRAELKDYLPLLIFLYATQ
jgi:RNA polymerase sigma-70 factor (ECF subfamily)